MGRFAGVLKVSIRGILAVTAVLLVVGCSRGFVPEDSDRSSGTAASAASAASSAAPTNGAVQSHDGGKVTIDVEWLGVRGDELTFSVSMNTHSVDLDSYDLGELAMLRDDQGHEYHAVSWESAAGGHHRRGTLTFAPPDSLQSGEAKSLELVIRDVAEIHERVMTWHLD